MDNQELILDTSTMREITKEIKRVFGIHTRNVVLHFDEWGVQITVFPPHGTTFKLPEGPRDIRLDQGKWWL